MSHPLRACQGAALRPQDAPALHVSGLVLFKLKGPASKGSGALIV